MPKVLNKAAELLRAKPLASFSVTAFVFAAFTLTLDFKLLAVTALIFSFFVIFLNFFKLTDNFILVFLILSMFLGIFSASARVRKNEMTVSEMDGESVRIEGRVVSVPSAEGNAARFFLKTSSVYYSGGKYGGNFKIYLTCGEKCEIKYGDVLVLNAKLYEAAFSDFDMNRYIFSKGGALMGSADGILSVKRSGFPYSVLSGVRNYLLSAGDLLEGSSSGLFRALTAGDRSRVSEDVYGDFSSAGIAHIICISGMHISLLGYAVYRLFARLGDRAGRLISIAAAFSFAAVAGCTPSSVRAAVMYAIFILADMFILQRDFFTALAFSAAIMVLSNAYVVFDFGFILSYLSVLGIHLFSPRIKAALSFLPKSVADTAAGTFSAQLLTTPVVLVYFGTLSVYSIAANIAVSLIFPAVLYACLVFSFTAYIPGISLVTSLFCRLSIDALCAAAKFFSSLPFGSIKIDNFGTAAVMAYVILAAALLFSGRLSKLAVGAAMVISSIILLFSSFGYVRQVPIAENSLYLSGKSASAAVINDDLSEVCDIMRSLGTAKTDLLFFADARSSASEVGSLIRLTGAEKVYLPQGAESYDAASAAKRSGAEVYFHPYSEPESGELFKYAEDFCAG